MIPAVSETLLDIDQALLDMFETLHILFESLSDCVRNFLTCLRFFLNCLRPWLIYLRNFLMYSSLFLTCFRPFLAFWRLLDLLENLVDYLRFSFYESISSWLIETLPDQGPSWGSENASSSQLWDASFLPCLRLSLICWKTFMTHLRHLQTFLNWLQPFLILWVSFWHIWDTSLRC